MYLTSSWVKGAVTFNRYEVIKIRYCTHQYTYLLTILRKLKGHLYNLTMMEIVLSKFQTLKAVRSLFISLSIPAVVWYVTQIKSPLVLPKQGYYFWSIIMIYMCSYGPIYSG